MYEDTGYSSYRDPRLQPPEAFEPTDGEISHETCRHAAACERQREMRGGVDGPIWEAMECGDCDEWEARA